MSMGLFSRLVNRVFASYSFSKRLEERIDASLTDRLPSFHPLSAWTGNPYRLADEADRPPNETKPGALFITARFRSGSTLLWNMFHHLQVYTSYYEPLNEAKWFSYGSESPPVDPSHVGVKSYASNYRNLSHLDDFFSPDWATRKLYMTETSVDWNLQQYIETLVAAADKFPVLQFNRVDFRLLWLRAHFPSARILHLIRDPREQWTSVLFRQDVPDDIAVADFVPFDRFYLLRWARNLASVFPCLRVSESAPAYRAHYLLWRLSQMYGVEHGDLTVKYEDLVDEPRRVLEGIVADLELPAPPADCWPNATALVQKPEGRPSRETKAEAWFDEQEAACEKVLFAMFGRKIA